MITWTATATTPQLNATIAHFLERLQGAVTETAHAIQQEYENTAPRDTGSMALSVSVTTPDGSDYGERIGQAQSVNPKVKILGQLTPPPAPGAVVQVPVGHAIYMEYGTTRVPARPTFNAAVEQQREPFKMRVRQVVVS